MQAVERKLLLTMVLRTMTTHALCHQRIAIPFFYRRVILDHEGDRIREAADSLSKIHIGGRRVGSNIKILRCMVHSDPPLAGVEAEFDVILSHTRALQQLVTESEGGYPTADGRLLNSISTHVGHSLRRLTVDIYAFSPSALEALGRLQHLEDLQLKIIPGSPRDYRSLADATPWDMPALRLLRVDYNPEPFTSNIPSDGHLTFLARCRFSSLQTLTLILPKVLSPTPLETAAIATFFKAHPDIPCVSLGLYPDAYQVLLPEIAASAIFLQHLYCARLPSADFLRFLGPDVHMVILEATYVEISSLVLFLDGLIASIHAKPETLRVKLVVDRHRLPRGLGGRSMRQMLEQIRKRVPALAEGGVTVVENHVGEKEIVIQ
jgi:hypothetical protein